MILASLGIIAGKGSIPMDTDAQAFITAASITDNTQKNAINQLVLDLKTANIWTKMKAIYPFVGGTASSHRFNLKVPTTNISDFYITFSGGITHSTTGVAFNGATGWANTNLVPSTHLTSPFIGYYSRTNGNTGTDQIDMGSKDASNLRYLWVSAWYNGSGFSNVLARNTSSTVLLNGGTTTNSRGWYWTNKVSGTAKLGKNSSILSSASDSQTPPTSAIGIGCLNTELTPNSYSNRECAFSVIADGMSDTDTTNLYNAVQTFNTTLGRQV